MALELFFVSARTSKRHHHQCTLCKKAHEESGSSWNRELPKETIGHIQSAGCLGQKEVVIAAHNECIRELLQDIDGHRKADRHIKLLTIETESRLVTLGHSPHGTVRWVL